jgi:galactonate dehydratase
MTAHSSRAAQSARRARRVASPPTRSAAAHKIVEQRVTVVGTPWRELVFVELTTDSGLVGVGECRIVNKTDTLVAAIHELGPRYVVGTDPFDVERLAWNMQRAVYGRPGEVTQSALATFDVACGDLMGQILGVPLWKLLGGCFRDRVPAYANGWYQAQRDPKVIARLARGVVKRGYRGLKLDPFGAASAELSAPERRKAVAIVAAVREAVGPDVQIMVEMHGRFTPGTAAQVAALLEPYDPEWIEEPVPPENPAALARVRAATRLTIATGERAHTAEDIRPFLEQGNVDVVQVDLTHFGGFLPMKPPGSAGPMLYPLLALVAARWARWPTSTSRWPRRIQGARALQRLCGLLGAGPCGRAPAHRSCRRLLHVAHAPRSRPQARSRGLRAAPAYGWTHPAVRRGLGAPRLRRREDRGQAALMTAAAVELVLDARAELGEGPRWDPRGQRLLWVDIMRGRIHAFQPGKAACRSVDAGRPVGARVRRGRWRVYWRSRAGSRDWIGSRAASTCWPPSKRTVRRIRMNDGACDPAGRFWAGTMALDERPQRARCTASTRTDVHMMLTEVSISNGID